MTKSQTTANDIAALLRARNALIWITTTEEARAERYLIEACAAAGYVPRTWDCAQGVAGIDGRVQADIGSVSIDDTLNAIRLRADTSSERAVWIIRDVHRWIGDGIAGATIVRQLRNLARYLPGVPRDRAQAVIVITPSGEVPPDLQGHATCIDWPAPDREEVAAILDTLAKTYSLDLNGARDAAIDAAVGLSGEEAAACYAKSLVQLKRVDPAAVNAEKKRVISKSGTLEWMEPLKGGFDSVGGLDVIKTWTNARAIAYTAKARAYGLPAPRGIFLVGVSGCGKTLISKAIAASLGNVPLLRYDLGAQKSKFVGESEQNTRKAQRTIESVGKCVVLIDEIEKALAGATQGAADGGVSADALGSLLTWMQERTSEAFLVATSNDVSQLPPELLRKGRWDELFWVDLPTSRERIEVLKAALRMHGRSFPDSVDWNGLAIATERFTGAEISALVPDAMFAAFADGEREVDANDIVRAAANVTPLAETSKEKINAMRAWAKGRARPATTPEKEQTAASVIPGRVLDL
jgi:SpoVK/Ycf46/Vps4 family AAA+-type ATPase